MVNEELIKDDLSNCNLLDIDLSDTDLTGKNLSGSVLIRTNLSRAILIDANLSNAKFIGTVLTGADLTGANLTGASFIDVDLSYTNVTDNPTYNSELCTLTQEDVEYIKTITAFKDGKFHFNGKDDNRKILKRADLEQLGFILQLHESDNHFIKLYNPHGLPPRRLSVEPCVSNMDSNGNFDYWRIEIDNNFLCNISTVQQLKDVIWVFTQFEVDNFNNISKKEREVFSKWTKNRKVGREV